MNFDLISILVFYSVILLFFLKYKKRFVIQGIIVLYKTKLGLKMMDRLAKLNPKLIRLFANAGIVVGFLGMAFGFVFLIKETAKYLIVPDTIAPLIPLLPGISIPGIPALSFWHWIIGIFIAAIVHESSHGIIARFHNVPIKSSGIAFLGPVMAAFVEPDETEMNKKKAMHQIGILAAGPFSNILLGIVFFILFAFVTGPIWANSITPGGIIAGEIINASPSAEAGLETPFTITEINGQETLNAAQFVNASMSISPGDKVTLITDKGEKILTASKNPENESRGYLGLAGLEQKFSPAGIAEGKPWRLSTLKWLHLLVMWMFVINIGIAVFNLLPFAIVDGGRMSLVALQAAFPKKGKNIWLALNVITISLIVINVLPWIFKLLAWTFQMFITVITLLP